MLGGWIIDADKSSPDGYPEATLAIQKEIIHVARRQAIRGREQREATIPVAR
jgi:hypothetical protein